MRGGQIGVGVSLGTRLFHRERERDGGLRHGGGNLMTMYLVVIAVVRAHGLVELWVGF